MADGSSQGTGWGGPARPNNKGVKDIFDEDPEKAAAAKKYFMDKRPELLASKKERVRAMEDVLLDIALNEGQHPGTRVNAASRLHAIYEGNPVNKNINANVDDVSEMSDEQLNAELSRVQGKIAEASSGATSAVDSDELPGVVH